MEKELYLLVGTYTDSQSKGIYVYRFNTRTGNMEVIDMAEVENPSYVTSDKAGNFIYAVSENEGSTSYANALSFDRKTGKLKLLNRRTTKGHAPCNIVYDERRRRVITANYEGRNINVFPVAKDGTLKPVSQVIEFSGSSADKERQEAPHLHCVMISPDGKYLFASDLGTDNLYRFDINSSYGKDYLDKSSQINVPVDAGSGPRHFVFHPGGRFMYLINELSGKVMSFTYRAGELELFQTIDADLGGSENAGDIVITPDGKFLYASIREENDGFATYSVDPEDGRLYYIAYTNTDLHPRNMSLSPEGDFLVVANMKSNSMEVFEIPELGIPRKINEHSLEKAVCTLFIKK